MLLCHQATIAAALSPVQGGIFMSMNQMNLVFLENLEWFDDTGVQLVQRIPQEGSGEIKYGAQLTVRENQTAVFYYKGKALEAFGPGRHTLKTANIPILTKIVSLPWGLSSPLRAEVYFVNMKVFTNLKWGTRDPVAFKDTELGLVRLRAYGVFNLRVVQPVLMINRLVGTQGVYTTTAIEEYLNQVIISRFNDHMGESLDSLLSLPSHYDSLSEGMMKRMQDDFSHFGLALTHLYINAITPPPEVQKAIDERSRMGAISDMHKLMQMKTAMAVEKAAEGSGDMTGAGMGAGLGLMMPAMLARYFDAADPQSSPAASVSEVHCPECRQLIPLNARFCPYCGHQQLVFQQCVACGKNLTPNARFCSRCGHPADRPPENRVCRQCGNKNLTDAVYCNACGEKL
jgi:membrane protease subunit (stomatin/prohibitin family)